MANTHMNIFVVMLALALGPGHSFACSPMANSPATFEPDTATQNSVAPGIPEISIEHISRGGDRPDSCSDIGRIVLSIASAQEAYAYRFTVTEGKSPSDGFDDTAVVGYVSNGRQTFQFSWHELGKAAPLDFKVRVTAYSKAGSEGGFIILRIFDDGRK
jgi:hypothetical protein